MLNRETPPVSGSDQSGTTAQSAVVDTSTNTVDIAIPWYNAPSSDSFGANFGTGAYDDTTD